MNIRAQIIWGDDEEIEKNLRRKEPHFKSRNGDDFSRLLTRIFISRF